MTNQQVVYLQPQQTYPGAQGGMIIIQPSGAMTTVPQGHPVAAQQQGYLPHQVNNCIIFVSYVLVYLHAVTCATLLPVTLDSIINTSDA